MKTLVAAFITALVVFTLATVWIDFVRPRWELLASAMSAGNRGDGVSRFREMSDEDDTLPAARSKGMRSSRTSRETQAANEENRLKLLAQLEQFKQEETKLVERQKTMELLYSDIFRELAEVESIRRKSDSELAQVERQLLTSADNKRAAAPPNNVATQSPRSASARESAEKRIAMAVQSLVDKDRIPAAAAMLSGLKDREVAKVLSLLNTHDDPKLVIRLSDQVQMARQAAIRR